MAEKVDWSRRFDDPIKTPDGKTLRTLKGCRGIRTGAAAGGAVRASMAACGARDEERR
jgi:hypothetical protein